MKINRKRFLDDMNAQAKFGATPEGGLSRPALSEPNIAVRNWFKDRVKEADLAFSMDGAANLSAILYSDNPNAKTLMMGSHLDSVLDGGRFDGPLGVISALEVIRTLKEQGKKLPFHIEAISFTDEEGNLLGLLGSRAVAGLMTREALENPMGGRDTLLAGMARVGINDDSILAAKRNPNDIFGYLEVHIEQGKRLENANLNIGIVTSLVGIRQLILTFIGEAAHSGTMPILDRKDAFLGAARFAEQARQLVIDKYLPGVVNVGKIQLSPGAFNIVPGKVIMAVEYRHGTNADMNAMKADLIALAESIATQTKLDLAIEHKETISPASMDPKLMAHIENSAASLGLSHTQLMSFAGHDPQNMANIVPSAMFFVPSVDGISHNPREYTRPEDCINAANVMLGTVLQLAEAE